MRLDYFGRKLWLGVLVLASMSCGIANAQRASVWSHTESYNWNSGLLSPGSRVSHVVQSPGATWMQLRFANVKLGSASYIKLTSLQNGATQILNAKTLRSEGNLSAYFTGDRVRVELHAVAPDWSGASIRIDQVEVGEMAAVAESQCGSIDDRTPSNHPAVARATNGCTAWIISNGNLLTAGHCASGLRAVEFNVPPSTSGGGLVRSNPRDQYTVVAGSIQSAAGQIGNDWAVFRVQNNSQTGLSPLQAQGTAFNLTRRTSLGTIRVTGHGTDGGTRNQVQQTHTGPLTSLSGTRLSYVVDTEGGNSGSPVIDEASGEAVGIHTHGGCSATGGSNNGTHASLAALWNAANSGGSGGGTSVTVQENATGFCGVDGTVDTNNAGFTGPGYANTNNALGAAVRWRINAGTSGDYTLRWRYANGSGVNRPGTLVVDGTSRGTITFAPSASWTTWIDSGSATLALTAGAHSVQLTATTSAGLTNIDSFTVTGSSVSAAACN